MRPNHRSPSDCAPEDLLTTFEASQYIRLSVATLERMRVTSNSPTFIKLGPGKGARVVYRRADLDAWLHAQRRTSTSQRGADE